MGIFSFIKGAGAKIFGGKEKEAPKEEIPVIRANALLDHVKGLGLPFKRLRISVKENVVTVEGEVEKQDQAEKIVLAIGNVDGVEQVDNKIEIVEPAPEAQFHTVVSGDNLSKISKKFYGNPNKYNIIFEANKPMLTHPDKIYPGQVLRIPPLT